MKFFNFYRKPISMFVMVSFTVLLCFWANQAPAAPVSAKNAETTMEQGDHGNPNFVEQEKSDETGIKKPKKFPWLLIGAVVVVGAAALYFLVLKTTKYTLTVSLGAGTSGTPATGKYKKDEVVAYSFSAQAGYAALKVMLDGVEVPAAGNVTMDKEHTLAASATQGAVIQVNSTPAGAQIYLDKVDSGQVTPHTFNYPAAATKAVLLRHQCGYQEWTQTVTANLGQEIVVNADLKTGILENFEIPLSSCWQPRTAADWTVNGGGLKGAHTMLKGYEFNIYNHAFSGDFTVIVKHKIEQSKGTAYSSVLLKNGSDMTNCQSYEFACNTNRSFAVYKNTGYNFVIGKGSYKSIKPWTANGAFNKGNGVWNTIKIVKAGANYTYYANNIPLFSFVNAEYAVGYITLVVWDRGMTANFDSVQLTAGSAGDSIPGLPLDGVPATTDKMSSDR